MTPENSQKPEIMRNSTFEVFSGVIGTPGYLFLHTNSIFERVTFPGNRARQPKTGNFVSSLRNVSYRDQGFFGVAFSPTQKTERGTVGKTVQKKVRAPLAIATRDLIPDQGWPEKDRCGADGQNSVSVSAGARSRRGWTGCPLNRPGAFARGTRVHSARSGSPAAKGLSAPFSLFSSI